jgi:hypothetical protein
VTSSLSGRDSGPPSGFGNGEQPPTGSGSPLQTGWGSGPPPGLSAGSHSGFASGEPQRGYDFWQQPTVHAQTPWNAGGQWHPPGPPTGIQGNAGFTQPHQCVPPPPPQAPRLGARLFTPLSSLASVSQLYTIMEVGDVMTGRPALSVLEAQGKGWRASRDKNVSKDFSVFQRTLSVIKDRAVAEGVSPAQIASDLDSWRHANGTKPGKPMPVATFIKQHLLRAQAQSNRDKKAAE